MKIVGKHLFTSLLKSLPECSVEIKLNPNMCHGLQCPVQTDPFYLSDLTWK